MPQKLDRSYHYEEIDVIQYFRVIKKHFFAILGIALSIVVLAIIVMTQMDIAIIYMSEVTLSIGMVSGAPIESGDAAVAFVNDSYPNVSAQKGSGPEEVLITALASSQEEVETHIKEAVGGLLARHAALSDSAIKKRKIEIASLHKRIKDQENILNNYQRMVDRLGFSPQAQAIALQTYVSNYSGIIEKIHALRSSMETLQLQEENDTPTEVTKNPTLTTQREEPQRATIIVAAILLGFLMGLLWAFYKDWWDRNKRLL